MIQMVLALLIALQATPAAESTPTAGRTAIESLEAAQVYAGQVSIATKEYDVAGSPFFGLYRLDFNVRAFATSGEAMAGIETRRSYLFEGSAIPGITEVSFPPVGDASFAAVSQEDVDDRIYDYAYLTVSTGSLLYTWFAASNPGTPLTDFEDIADSFFPVDPTPFDQADPESLLSVLPGFGVLPTGFVLDDSAALATDGIPRAATPTA